MLHDNGRGNGPRPLSQNSTLIPMIRIILFAALATACLHQAGGAVSYQQRISPSSSLPQVIADIPPMPTDAWATIEVGPGDYYIPTNVTSLLKHQLHLHFLPGARILSGNSSDTNSRALFTDASGAINASVTGWGEFYLSNSWGAILLITNPSSTVTFEAFRSSAATNMINSAGVVSASFYRGVPNRIDVVARGTAIENGALLTNAVKNAPSGSTVFIHPGRYHTPTNTLPSVMLKTGVDQYWYPGAIWYSGTEGGETAYMFDDTGGAVSCNIYGSGRFALTNDGAAIIGLTAASTVHFEAASFDAKGDGAGVFTLEGGASLDIEWTDYAWTHAYDIGFGNGTSAKLRLRGSKAYPAGDLVEFTDFDNWGDCLISVDYLRKTNTGSALQIGGRQLVQVKNADLWANSYVTSYPINTGTNGIIYDSLLRAHPTNRIPVFFYTPGASQSGLLLKNVSLYGPTNCDALTITNVAANPLVLENCAIYNGWGATNWVRGLTVPANVHIIGALALRPVLPSNGVTMTVSGRIP